MTLSHPQHSQACPVKNERNWHEEREGDGERGRERGREGEGEREREGGEGERERDMHVCTLTGITSTFLCKWIFSAAIVVGPLAPSTTTCT